MSTPSPGALDARPGGAGRSISRTRLAGRVSDALESGSLIITAGAGFGKTTILDQALGGTEMPVAWINCSERERGPGILVMRIVNAISEATPGASDALAERLVTGIEPIDPVAAMRELLAELSRLLVEPLVLVVDEAEHLDGADGSLRLVAEMIRAELPRLHVAVATRRTLDLRVAKPRAAGHLVDLSAADLVFDGEECTALLRARTEGEPSRERVDAVMEATEGWPLGIALMAAAVERGKGGEADAVRTNLSSTPDLRAYLSEELLDSLDPGLRAAAIDSSVARLVTAEVAAALDLPKDFAERLERAGMLVRPLGGERGFAYHPLLREFLQESLRDEREPEERRRLHAAVAPAVAEGGDAIGAIEHWLEAESWPDAVAAIEREGLTLVKTNPAMLRRWISSMPMEVSTQPTIQALHGQLEWIAGDNAKAIEMLRSAIRGFRDQPNAPADWLARSVLADALFATGRLDEMDEVVEGWNEPSAAPAGGLAPAAVAYAAVVLAAYGRFDESDRLVSEAKEHPDAAFLEPLDGLRLAFRDGPRGDLDAALKRLKAADLEMERFDPLNRRAHVLGAVAAIELDRGYPEESLRLWLQIREMSASLPPVLVDATHAWCAFLHGLAGRLADAESEIGRHRRGETGYRAFIAELAPAVVASLRGDAAETLAHADRALASVEGGPVMFRYWVGADLVPALAAVGSVDRAREVLADTLSDVDEALPGELGYQPRGRLLGLRAWLHHLDGDPESAHADLLACQLESGDALPFVLRREWVRLEPVIWDALERGAVEPQPLIDEVASAFPEGLQLLPFLDHPDVGVRRAALGPALNSGSPEALAHLKRLEKDSDEGMAEAARRAADRLAASMPALRFEVLGGFAVRRGSWRVEEGGWGRPIDARLMRFLLVHLDEPVVEDLIFEALWPGLAASSARRSLQVAVSRVRRLLDPPHAEESIVQSADRTYRLALGNGDTVDAEEFRSAAELALAERGEDRLRLLERARSLWGGEALPEERYSDWAASYRERLTDRHVAVLTALIESYLGAGEHIEAADAARELADLDPLNEEGHRALMTSYARSGRRGHALRQYLECRRALVDSLGVEPAQATSRLQARILAGEGV
jgi:ATP/maltotriose-dependent transcriptional regulator MalT/DNA-binding SARP family transcriptional activator